VRRLTTDRDGARALRGLLDGQPGRQRLRSSSAPQLHGVTVEILSDIAAGDYSQHQAKLLTIQGGAQSGNGSTVPVRHVGEGKVTAGTKVIVEPCGRLGLCFVRTDGGQPEVGITLQRMTKAVGPQSGYFGDEDLNWTNYGQSFNDLGWDAVERHFTATGPRWYLLAPFSETPDSDTDDGRIFTLTWNRKLYPFRWKIHDYEADGPHFPYQGQYDPVRQNPLYFWPGSLFARMINPEPGDYGPSSTTLGPNSHLWPMTLTGLELPAPFWFLDQNGIWPGVSGFATGVWTYCDLTVRAYRVWIDGADVTGVVSAAAGDGAKIINWQYPTQGQCTLSHILADIPDAQHQSKTIEFDVWLNATFRYQAELNSGGTHTNPTIDKPMAIAPETAYGRLTRLKSANIYENISGSETWRLTFADVTVDGYSSVTSVEQPADWDWLRSTGGDHWLTDLAEIRFQWGREIPLVEVEIYDLQIFAYLGVMVYAPADSGDYGTLDLEATYPGLRDYTPGVWNPASSTTFVPIGIVESNYYHSYLWPNDQQRYPWDHPNAGDLIWSSFPSSITVEPV
jgi:hypothetical protein